MTLSLVAIIRQLLAMVLSSGTERNRTDSKQLHVHGVVIVVHFCIGNSIYVVSTRTFATIRSLMHTTRWALCHKTASVTRTTSEIASNKESTLHKLCNVWHHGQLGVGGFYQILLCGEKNCDLGVCGYFFSCWALVWKKSDYASNYLGTFKVAISLP